MLAPLFHAIVLSIIILGFAFWTWMIVDCVTNEPREGNEKLIWIVIILFTNIIGAMIYYFVRRPQRWAQFCR